MTEGVGRSDECGGGGLELSSLSLLSVSMKGSFQKRATRLSRCDCHGDELRLFLTGRRELGREAHRLTFTNRSGSVLDCLLVLNPHCALYRDWELRRASGVTSSLSLDCVGQVAAFGTSLGTFCSKLRISAKISAHRLFFVGSDMGFSVPWDGGITPLDGLYYCSRTVKVGR